MREKPATFVTGDRFASIYDPFGHRWAVMTRVEDVSPEEAERRRLAEWAGRRQGRRRRCIEQLRSDAAGHTISGD